MASLLSKLASMFSGSGSAKQAAAEPPVRFRDFDIIAAPFKDGNHWRLAGIIRSADPDDTREHHFIRSDVFSNADDAKTFAIRKAQLIIEQNGERILDDPGVRAPL